MVELAIPCVCLTKRIKLVHLPSLCLFFFFFALLLLPFIFSQTLLDM